MQSFDSVETAKHILLSFSIILATGAVSGFLAKRLNIPDVAIFLVAGVALGPEVLGLITIKVESVVNQIILIFGSCFILFDGGASVRFSVLREVWITIVMIATFGVMIMTTVTGIAAHYIFDVPLIIALLLGAVLAATDPATIIPIFKQIRIRERVAQTIMSESAFNDAMGAIVTFAFLAVATGAEKFSIQSSLADLLKQSLLGIAAGAVVGYGMAYLIAHQKYDFLSQYAPAVTLMSVLGAYFGANGLHASGFMAVFVFGIILGNRHVFGLRMESLEEVRLEEFVLRTALVMRMFIFILLGAQVDFGLMKQYLVGGFAVVLIFMLIARPLTVFACALPDRRAKWSFKEMLLMCWARETGVIPAALAGLLMGMNAPGAKMIESVTFIAIVTTILIQATTTRVLARKLGLLLEE